MTWFSFVFPNTALVTATFAVGDAFGSVVIQIIGFVMTCILVVVWIFAFGMMIRASNSSTFCGLKMAKSKTREAFELLTPDGEHSVDLSSRKQQA